MTVPCFLYLQNSKASAYYIAEVALHHQDVGSFLRPSARDATLGASTHLKAQAAVVLDFKHRTERSTKKKRTTTPEPWPHLIPMFSILHVSACFAHGE